MVIKSLVQLYERLLEQKLVAPNGWDRQKITYCLVLSKDGKLKDIQMVKIKVPRGKKEVLVPNMVMLPQAVVRTNKITPNFLWDNAGYVLGYNPSDVERGYKAFHAFRKKHHEVLDGVPSVRAMAILSFLDQFDPSMVMDDPVLLAHHDALDDTGNFTFRLEGDSLEDVSDDEKIRKAWDIYRDNTSSSDDAVFDTCIITGKKHQKIATVHPKIKGIQGADASGAALVCYNVKSVCSYNGDGMQSVNSHISEYAASAYAKALNYLLSDLSHRLTLGNVTVVYWSESNSDAYGRFFDTIMNKNDGVEGKYSLNDIMKNIADGRSISFDGNELSPSEPFYILGLGSSGSRASIRFFWKNSFGNVVKNMAKHQDRLWVDRPEKVKNISAYTLLKAAASPGAEVPSPVIDSLFNSIMTDSPYPPGLYANILHRVKMDRDDKAKGTMKINYIKAGFIKAYLVKNGKEKWKELDSVSLNEGCENRPYLLGRLFAMLEGIQRQAMPGINSTIRDRYFNSASCTPGVVFPTLLRLSHAHMRKLAKPLAIYLDKKITGMVDRITLGGTNGAFPSRLSPEEQGAFMLGYYHERQAVFNKKKEKAAAAENANETVTTEAAD